MDRVAHRVQLLQAGAPDGVTILLHTTHLLPLSELAQETGIAVDYLGWLARHGKLEAMKRGRYWYASREAVQRYQQDVDEEQRGRPRGRKREQ